MTYESKNYVPAFAAWQDFVNNNPHMGLTSTQGSFRRFMFVYGDQMKATGAVVIGNGKYLLAHKEKFPVDAFAVLIGKLEEVA